MLIHTYLIVWYVVGYVECSELYDNVNLDGFIRRSQVKHHRVGNRIPHSYEEGHQTRRLIGVSLS